MSASGSGAPWRGEAGATVPGRPLARGHALIERGRATLRDLSRGRLGLAFMLPAVALVGMVTLYPIVDAFITSTYDTFFLKRTRFIGLQHYVRFLADTAGRVHLWRTLTFVVSSVGLSLPLGLVLALVLNERFPLRTLFRTITILPWIVSQLVTALLFVWLLNSQYGPVNYLFREWFSVPIEFLGDPKIAMASLVLAGVWQSYPYPMLLILAALQTIPPEVNEAAIVDGATGWSKFSRITFPLIAHTVMVCLIMQNIHFFNMVTLPLVLTGGGPVGATDVVGLRVYRDAFINFKIGQASAIAMYMLLFNVVFSLFYIHILRRNP